MKQVVDKSEAFSKLEEAFGTFKKQFRQEATSEGHSIEKLEEDINKEVQKWNISFGIDMSSIKTENIIKNFLTHYIADSNLEGEHVSIDAVGQGLQRHLIYTLIKLSAQYKTPTTSRKNKFLPDFTLILFEEPELFLHPSQQKVMNQSLQSLANNEGQQVLITTHSTEFVSRNVFDLTSLIRVSKPYMKNTCLWQLDRSTLNSICDKNFSLSKIFTDLLKNENTNEQLKNKIKDKKLGDPNANEQEKLNEEHIRYFLWLDTERTAAFFAKHVLICEGASEKIAIEYLIANQWSDLIEKHIYVLDAMGKYNIHRYMSLFEKLGITHSVLMDKDKDNEINNIVNDFIRKKQHNQFTIKIHMFDKDLEDFLNIEKPNRNDAKPLHILKLLSDKEVDPERIKEFRSIINQLLGLP
jgi:predicted ATP-dependent endonuclease of OLD family